MEGFKRDLPFLVSFSMAGAFLGGAISSMMASGLFNFAVGFLSGLVIALFIILIWRMIIVERGF